MGIKHFFNWFKKRFTSNIYQLKVENKLSDIKERNIDIDNLLIDMNGIFHNSAQKIYEYGNYKPRERLLGNRKNRDINFLDKQLDIFKHVCETVDTIFNIVSPKKRLILCVDGPAPLGKQNQQRQRRFVSAKDNHSPFDSNSITPGTKFMDYLSKYIDWFIRKKITFDENWKHIEVIFSNEKAPGEGEHKLMNFIRKFGNDKESFCVHSMDADLIMLCLGLTQKNIWILRDDTISKDYAFYLIDIDNVKTELIDIMKWDDLKTERKFYDDAVINDFILMCFTVGNDFLPNIPAIEIIQGAIEFMFDVYKNTCSIYGHLTKTTTSGIQFHKESLGCFLGTVSQYEKGVFQEKLKHKDLYFPYEILEKNAKFINGNPDLNIENFRKDYYLTKLSHDSVENICHDYLEGMAWVLNYYTKGVGNWTWRYKYHYAPFCFDLKDHIKSYKQKKYDKTFPTTPFVQLLSVLPPKSWRLLPKPLDIILKEGLKEFCPDNFEIDLSGKRQTWEGTVILPSVDYEKISKVVNENYMYINDIDKKRNILGKSFIYYRCHNNFTFKSFYGNIECYAMTKPIEI